MYNFLKKLVKQISQDKSLFYAILFVVGVLLLRLFNIDGFTTFLGDQGRDALIIKRIVTLEHLPAIGPITSIGQIFLGPFYYYFIAPWLLLSNFDPVGLSVGVAVSSAILLLTIYISTAKLFSKQFAWILLITSGTSLVMYEFARFSWNPNLLPYISFLVAIASFDQFKRRKIISAIFLGSLLSIAVQLHYIALVLLPPVGLLFAFYLFFDRNNVRRIIILALSSFISFCVVSFPLILFDLRHGFLNSRNFLKLFTQSEAVGGNTWDQFLDIFVALHKYIFGIELSNQICSYIIILLFGLLIWGVKKNREYSLIGLFFMAIIGGLSLYAGPKYTHYLAIVYLYYFAVIGIIIMSLPKKIIPVVMGIVLILFSYVSITRYDFLNGDPNFQARHAKRISNSIIPHISKQLFQITALPERYSDHTYRYYLEVLGKRPQEKDSLERAQELFVICEGRCDLIIGNPTWDIAFFAPKKIAKQWEIENVTIYKLTR